MLKSICRGALLLTVAGLIAVVTACSGPESHDDTDPTQVVAATATPAPTETDPPTTDATEPADPTATSTEAPEATPTPEPTPTPVPSPTATHIPVGMNEGLPTLQDLPGDNFALANQGARTAVDLANAYQDSAAHLERLNEWGFQEHVFREFTHQRTGPEDPSPSYFLATINEYGSPEQGDLFLSWWTDFAHTQGHTEIEPPDIGDNAYASEVPTSEGNPTAFLYVRRGVRVYAYYGEQGNPTDFVTQVATSVFERINTPPEE